MVAYEKLSFYFFSLDFTFFLMSSVLFFCIHINEIKFKGDEFVEIYSNETLNLTGMKVYDDNGISKFKHNELSLLKNPFNQIIL